MALYNKFRPLVFEDVVEQKHVVETLKNSVIHDRVSHAYLFCGTRGTGKTTVARIFARAINCLAPKDGNPCNECEICKGILSGNILDVVEIDAASNNSVDNIRDIRDEVVYKPSHARYKVYIIDEVHMLSTGAFNALLKTLEEPPRHVVFFLATTEPHKLPATILSRCQRFDFKRITTESIIKRITDVAARDGVILENSAARLVARLADGALRDALSILDQCITQSKGHVDYDHVLSVVGIVNDEFISEFVDSIGERNVSRLLGLIDKLVMEGKDIGQFVMSLIKYYRNLLLCKVLSKPEDLIDELPHVVANMKKQCEGYGRFELMQLINELSALESRIKWSTQPRVLLEVGLIKICASYFDTDQDSITARVAALEEKARLFDERLARASETGILQGAEQTGTGEVDMSQGRRPGGSVKDGISSRRKQEGTVETDISEAREPEETQVADISKGMELEQADKDDLPWEEEPERTRKTDISKGKVSETLNKPKAGNNIDRWEEIISRLKNSGKMGLYTNLLGTYAVEADGNKVEIVFKKAINKTIVSDAKNMDILKKHLSKELGREIEVRCITDDEISSKPLEYNSDDEILKKAKDFAKELQVPFNIIDN